MEKNKDVATCRKCEETKGDYRQPLTQIAARATGGPEGL